MVAKPVMHHAGVRRSDVVAATLLAPLAWPARSQAAASSSLHAERLRELEAQLAKHPHVRSLMIERGAQTFSHFRTDTSASTPLHVASVTKSVVGQLVGIAIERGILKNVDEPLSAFFPEFAGGAAHALSRVRLRHLLTLTSGLDPRGLDANTDHVDFMQRIHAPGYLANALSRRLVAEPGTRFYYSNDDAHLVAAALARRLPLPLTLADFASAELWAPLGITGAGWSAGQDGTPNGASGLRLSTRDMLRLGRLALQAGAWDGRQLANAAYLRDATTRRVDSDLPARGPKERWGYGYLWWVASTPEDHLPAFYASGYGGQFIYIVPALGLVIVAVTEQVSRQVAAQTAALVRDFALPAGRGM